MKKHLFLNVDLQSSIVLSSREARKLRLWLELASESFEQLVKMKIIRLPPKTKIPSFRVSLLICGNTRIKKLNRDFRLKDKVTDVLSFPAHEDLRAGIHAENVESGEIFLGDLAICWPIVKRQADEFSISIWDEFIHLFFHGCLHLLGYDHEVSLKEEKIMQVWEDKVLDLFSKNKKEKGT